MKLIKLPEVGLQKQPRRCFMKQGVYKKFAIFTGKHQYKSLFLIKLQFWRPEVLLKRVSNAGVFFVSIAKVLWAPILKNICERLLCKKIKIFFGEPVRLKCDLYIILQIKTIPWPYYYLFYCKYSLKKQKILWKAFSVAVIDITFVKMI